MITQLPDNLHPFVTNHPASTAYRIVMSSHEWTWTHEEQKAMAWAIVQRDQQLQTQRHDQDRVDWLETAQAAVGFNGRSWVCSPLATAEAKAGTLREAIDAAAAKATGQA